MSLPMRNENIKPALVAAVLLFAVLFLTNHSAVAGSKILIPDASFNFGKVPQQCSVSKTFWIKSVGDDTLRVTKVVPGCGCTQIPLEDSVLAPGDSASFQIIFSTHSYRGFVTKKPYLETNADSQKVFCEINAEILVDKELFRPVRLNPFKLDVSQFTVEPRRKATAWIINVSDQDLDIEVVDSAGKDFVVEIPAHVKANDSAEVVLTVNEDAVKKEFDQSFTFYVSDEVHSRFSLPVKRMRRIPVESKTE
jgi:hypothetical protein